MEHKRLHFTGRFAAPSAQTAVQFASAVPRSTLCDSRYCKQTAGTLYAIFSKKWLTKNI
jgi:hypothetical protein